MMSYSWTLCVMLMCVSFKLNPSVGSEPQIKLKLEQPNASNEAKKYKRHQLGKTLSITCEGSVGMIPNEDPFIWKISFLEHGKTLWKTLKNAITDAHEHVNVDDKMRRSTIKYFVKIDDDGKEIKCIAANESVAITINVWCKGRYGFRCSRACTDRHCANRDAPCTKRSGQCNGNCIHRWKNVACDSCFSDYYGELCDLHCKKRHCKRNERCDHRKGHCRTGCSIGWMKKDCTKKCDSSHYGTNCKLACADRHCKEDDACDPGLGRCTKGCLPGWTGESCNKKCAYGYYGQNCTGVCKNRHCKNDDSCPYELGNCKQGCLSGWLGISCNKSCSDQHHYGENCYLDCGVRHCHEDQTCPPHDGHCKKGCAPGWSGKTCLKRCSPKHFGFNCKEVCSERHCLKYKSVTCESKHGSCNRGCDHGWFGDACNNVHGAWGVWKLTGFAKCPSTCQVENAYIRNCSNPPPAGSGKNCIGDNRQIKLEPCTGFKCNLPHTSKQTSSDSDTEAIVVVSIITVLVIIGVVISLSIWRNRKTDRTRNTYSTFGGAAVSRRGTTMEDIAYANERKYVKDRILNARKYIKDSLTNIQTLHHQQLTNDIELPVEMDEMDKTMRDISGITKMTVVPDTVDEMMKREQDHPQNKHKQKQKTDTPDDSQKSVHTGLSNVEVTSVHSEIAPKTDPPEDTPKTHHREQGEHSRRKHSHKTDSPDDTPKADDTEGEHSRRKHSHKTDSPDDTPKAHHTHKTHHKVHGEHAHHTKNPDTPDDAQ